MFGSKGLVYERVGDLLSLWQFVYEGSLEFCMCNIAIKLLLMLNKGLFIFFFFNLNQSFVSFDGIFYECKPIKIGYSVFFLLFRLFFL